MAPMKSSTSASKAGPCVVQQGINDTVNKPTRKQPKNAARINKRSPISREIIDWNIVVLRSPVLNLTIKGRRYRLASTPVFINMKLIRLNDKTTRGIWLYKTHDHLKPLLLAGADLAAMNELEAATNALTIEVPIANNESEQPVPRVRFQRRRLNGKDRI